MTIWEDLKGIEDATIWGASIINYVRPPQVVYVVVVVVVAEVSALVEAVGIAVEDMGEGIEEEDIGVYIAPAE